MSTPNPAQREPTHQLPAQSSALDPEEFRQAGYQLIDWVSNYLTTLDDRPVVSDVEPGQVIAAVGATAPAQPESWEQIIADLNSIITPALTHWQSPNFFAFFPANNSGPSILGELVSAGLGVQGMLWATSPAATELETAMLDWMATELGLPNRFRSGTGSGGGVIQDSASSAALVAIVAARQRARVAGHHLSTHALFISDSTHSSVLKGARVAGYDDEQIITVRTSADGAIDPEALSAAINTARASGMVATFVCATIGSTAVGGVDDIEAVAAAIAVTPAADNAATGARPSLAPWLHVDAAYAGVAAICPEHRHLLNGLDRSDSFCTNAHKWMLTNFDCSLMWVADRTLLTDALSIQPSYLANAASDSGGVIDYRDWMVPLGRRFRALKLWFVIRRFGVEGLRDHIRRHVAMAEWLAHQIEADPRLAIVGVPLLGLVCFRHVDGDAATDRMGDALNRDRSVLLTLTTHHDQRVVRVSIGSTTTTTSHVHALWERIVGSANSIDPTVT